MGIVTIGFTGASGGSMGDLCDICLQAPSDETPQIQQIHIVAYHAVCGEVEKAMFGKASAVRA
jgi:D-sedoheptulose 7-phosphate isomerase